jgi:hypothetical protein
MADRIAVLRERIEFHTGQDLDDGDLEDTLRALDALTDPEQQFDPDALAEVPEFWVIHDKHEGTAIWWWDGTKITELVRQHDVIYGSANEPFVPARREARACLWDQIAQIFPTAPNCKADVCHDHAITHPRYCPHHIPEET